MISICQKIALDMNRQSTRVMIITTLAWLGLGIMSHPAQANLVRYDFAVEIVPAPELNKPLLGSQGNGFFVFDDDSTPVVDPFGVSYFSVSELSFEFLGRTYTENDDVGLKLFPEIPYPTVGFKNNVFLGLNYAVDSPSLTEAGFIFTAVEPSSSTDPFSAGRGARATRSPSNPISGKGLSVGGGDVGLSSGQVTYTLVSNKPEPQPVPETTSAFGLLALSAMSSLVLRHNSKRRMKQPRRDGTS